MHRAFQGWKKRNYLTAVLILFCALGTSAYKLKTSDINNALYRPHMQSIYQSLTKLLAFAVQDSDSMKPKDIKDAEAQLKNLAEHSKAIHALALNSDKGQEFLAQELENSSSQAYLRFKGGFRDQSRYFISEIVNACFGCHTSRSSPTDSQFTFTLSENVDLGDFDPLAKARFLSLSRRFEASEAEYEKILLADQLNSDQLINFDPLVEYLILTLRVKDDSERVLKTFTAMQGKNLPQVVKHDLLTWTGVIKKLRQEKKDSDPLGHALRLIGEAKAMMEFPRDRTGMVHFVLASKYLEEYLKQDNLDKALKARAYYELGGCEIILNSHFSSDTASAYFEEAIRLAPRTSIAKKAYARYEENTLYGFSGSSGLNLPDDEKKKLNELKKLSTD